MNTKGDNGKQYREQQLLRRTLWVCARIRNGKRKLGFLNFFAFKLNVRFQTAKCKSHLISALQQHVP